MELVRTSLRLKKNTKRNAERKARELDTTLQAIFNQALEEYLDGLDKQKAQKIVFHDQPIDTKLDNLKRDDYYSD